MLYSHLEIHWAVILQKLWRQFIQKENFGKSSYAFDILMFKLVKKDKMVSCKGAECTIWADKNDNVIALVIIIIIIIIIIILMIIMIIIMLL